MRKVESIIKSVKADMGYYVLLTFTICMLAASLLTGCSDDDKFTPEIDIDYPAEDLLNLPWTDSEQTIALKANTDWTIETDADWLAIAPRKGSGDATLTLYVEANAEETRTGKLNIRFPKAPEMDYVVELAQPMADDNALEGFESATFLGYGYDIFGKYACPAGKKRYAILSSAKLKSRQDSIDSGKLPWADNVLDVDWTREYDYSARTGSSYDEVSKSFNITAGISTEFMKFSAEMKASFSQNSDETKEQEFAIYSYNVSLGRAFIAIDEESEDADMWLTSDARKAINGTTSTYQGTGGMKKLIEKYGTHVIVGGSMGGRIDYSMVVDKESLSGSYDINAMVKGGYGTYFQAEVESEYKEAYKKNSSSCKTSAKVVGGNVSVIDATNFKDWFDSVVNDGKNVLMDFEDGDLIPIWRFCRDEARSKEIENYILGDFYKEAIADVYNTAYKEVNIGTFSTQANASLVKLVTIDGVPVAEMCHEYLPGVSRSERQIVVYPVVNGVTQMNNGFFVGNASVPPAKVVWSTNQIFPTIEPISGLAKGKVSKVYLKGKTITSTLPVGTTGVMNCTTSDYYMQGYKDESMYNYPVVKVGKQYWLREDFTGKKNAKGQSYGYSASLKGVYTNGIPYDGQTAGTVPEGWMVPTADQAKELIGYVENNADRLRTSSGISGMNIVKNSWTVLKMFEDYPYGTVFVETGWTYSDRCGYWVQGQYRAQWLNLYTGGTSMDVTDTPSAGSSYSERGFDVWPTVTAPIRYVRR